MKFLFDLFPVILFFAAFQAGRHLCRHRGGDRATFLQIGLLAALRRKIDTMLWVSLGIIIVFGGATLVLRDETFIKWKPTVLYWLFRGGARGSGAAVPPQPDPRHARRAGPAADPVWSRLNWSWAAFFALMGVANLFRRLHLHHRPVGQLQAVRRHRADCCCSWSARRCSSRATCRTTSRRRQAMTVAEEIRRRLQALYPARLIWSTKATSTSAIPAPRPAAIRTGTDDRVGRLRGKPTVARHRMIYQALGDLMQHPIHAFAITARTPGEATRPPRPAGEIDG